MSTSTAATIAAPAPRPTGVRRFFLCDGDRDGWAVDEDRRLTLLALDAVGHRTADPATADIIHACWWRPLMELPREALRGKHVICHMTGDPARCLGEPDFLAAIPRVTLWIAQSRSALHKLRTLGLPCAYVPYTVDAQAFASPGPDSALTAETRARVPSGSYIIANFHRDTAGFKATPTPDASGRRPYQPKSDKGPDLFAEILSELHLRGTPVVALLAGPRRHWLRQILTSRGVPFIFVGETTPGEDYPRNILPREQISQLYSLADLCLVTSRSEGGPRAVLEAAAGGLAVLSTPVGHAPDVLAPECLFRDPLEAVEKIVDDVRTGSLRRFAPTHRETVAARHTPASVQGLWRDIYRACEVSTAGPIRVSPPPAKPASRSPVISFWNKFTPPPWGGGNQFMMALLTEASRQGYTCTANGDGPAADAHIVNSIQFDIERFESLVPPGASRVLHRLDGPISILRGTPESLDQDRRCMDFNARYACATVIQSWHTISYLAQLGLSPRRPALILNACDPAIFHPPASPRTPGPRLRIIATSWSPNPGKGAAIYQWLDEHLDPARYEFTFVGNCPAKLRSARVLAPLPSEELAAELREHDVYLTASRNDPCSNALMEALSCGLPAIYLDSGGHPELTSFGGLPFTLPHEIPALLDRIRDHYAFYRALVTPQSITDVCRRYLSLLLADAPYAA